MTDWQLRMVQEAGELGLKISAATSMLVSPHFTELSEIERNLLHDQITQMQNYYHTLIERIAIYRGETK